MKENKDLSEMLENMNPKLNEGSYVFVSLKDVDSIPRGLAICEFRESEGITLIIQQKIANELNLEYDFVAKWISLELNSSLNAVGLTAAFSNALAESNISCNVVAAFYHDHIFVPSEDAEKAMEILTSYSEKHFEK